MMILPVQSTSFGAKLSNITIKDNAAESVNKLVDSFTEILNQIPSRNVKYANTTAVRPPRSLDYQINISKNERLSVIFDLGKPCNIFLNSKVNEKDGSQVIKSLYYYTGNPNAIMNHTPAISYTEYKMGSEISGNAVKRFKSGETVNDEIADKIKELVDSTLTKLGIK